MSIQSLYKENDWIDMGIFCNINHMISLSFSPVARVGPTGAGPHQIRTEPHQLTCLKTFSVQQRLINLMCLHQLFVSSQSLIDTDTSGFLLHMFV